MASWVGPILMLLLFFFAGLAIGIPMAFTMGVGSIITCATFFGMGQLQFALTSTWNVMNSESMLACPMFIFMAILLEQSGVADDLYKALHHWMGGLHGGLAMATVIIAAIIASVPPQVITTSSSGSISIPMKCDCLAARACLVLSAPQVREYC